jgi:hypothetical protein
MVNASKYLYIIAVSFSILLAECKTSVPENNEELINEVFIDSTNDAWLDCYINQHKWRKSDILSAKFSVKSDALFLNLDFRNNSVTYEYINFRILIGRDIKNINKQLVQVVNDTLMSTIIYSFSEIDYNSESFFPVNHMVLELKPTALVCISKVDTVRNSIDGTFKAIAVDEKQRKYLFRNGIFKNITYNKLIQK